MFRFVSRNPKNSTEKHEIEAIVPSYTGVPAINKMYISLLMLGMLGAIKFVLKITAIEICQHFLLHL